MGALSEVGPPLERGSAAHLLKQIAAQNEVEEGLDGDAPSRVAPEPREGARGEEARALIVAESERGRSAHLGRRKWRIRGKDIHSYTDL